MLCKIKKKIKNKENKEENINFKNEILNLSIYIFISYKKLLF